MTLFGREMRALNMAADNDRDVIVVPQAIKTGADRNDPPPVSEYLDYRDVTSDLSSLITIHRSRCS